MAKIFDSETSKYPNVENTMSVAHESGELTLGQQVYGSEFDPLLLGSDLLNTSGGAAEIPTTEASELHDGERIEMAITVFKPVGDVYSFWRDFSNIPKFMTHVKRIDLISDTQMLWHWRTIGNLEVSWEAEIIDDVPDKVISWKTLPGAIVSHAGSVWFKSALQGEATEVYLRLMYKIPGGKFVKGLAELFQQAPEQVLREDLKRLRCLIEAGEIGPELH